MTSPKRNRSKGTGLGLDVNNITRRDFLNSTLIGAGVSLLTAHAPATVLASQRGGKPLPPSVALDDRWYGYGGIGDYAASHGNTPGAVQAAHAIRHGDFNKALASATDTGELYDVVVVGAGLAGMGAAYEYRKHAGGDASCLVIDNHPVFGGEAKQNEFMVNGTHLYAPQGSNGFSIPDFSMAESDDYAAGDAIYYQELDIPTDFTYAEVPGPAGDLRFGRDNYGYLYWTQDQIDVSFFFDEQNGVDSPVHIHNPWKEDLKDLPLSETDRKALLQWEHTEEVTYSGPDYRQWLDTMSYKDYLEKELSLTPAVAKYCDPVLASAVGLGCDAISAFGAFNVALPGFKGYEKISIDHRHSFPGGNSGFLRYFVKRTKPEAIEGKATFEEILNNPIQFHELDKAGQGVRIRLDATVVDVRHNASTPSSSDYVWVTYTKNGKTFRVRARSVIMASGGWVNKHVVRDLPEKHQEAYGNFHHSPILVANVALTNWRFIEKLGATGTFYEGGFGSFCNIRAPMHVGDHKPALHPDQPAILTFYVPYWYPGHPIQEQGVMGRMEMLTTPFAEYERQIREQLVRLYGDFGFDPKSDIAAIILNRWGHAYVNPQPGFFYGKNGEPAPRDIVSRNHGRIAFAHSELRGNQHWGPAAMEGRRAVNQLAEFFKAAG